MRMSRTASRSVSPARSAASAPPRPGAWLLCGLALWLSACSAPSAASAGATGATASAGAAATSATDTGGKPGINQPFLDPAMNVDEFVKAFEGESREIAKYRDHIVAALGVKRGMGVADVGAGTGLFMEPLAQAVGPHGKLFVLEISAPFLEHLRERAVALELPQIDVRACTDHSLELPDTSLDLAFVCDTYHHFEHPQDTLASLRRALRPGGTLVIVDFERIPGTSRPWVLNHMRVSKADVRTEVEAAGFVLLEDVKVDGLSENYLLRFQRP